MNYTLYPDGSAPFQDDNLLYTGHKGSLNGYKESVKLCPS